jgi:hypothetical protein
MTNAGQKMCLILHWNKSVPLEPCTLLPLPTGFSSGVSFRGRLTGGSVMLTVHFVK